MKKSLTIFAAPSQTMIDEHQAAVQATVNHMAFRFSHGISPVGANNVQTAFKIQKQAEKNVGDVSEHGETNSMKN